MKEINQSKKIISILFWKNIEYKQVETISYNNNNNSTTSNKSLPERIGDRQSSIFLQDSQAQEQDNHDNNINEK